jgi:hypothetical protein
MAHSRYLRQMARSLRVGYGYTVDELAERLSLPRSTIYYWVRDLPLRDATPRRVAPEPARAELERVLQSPTRAERAAAYEEALQTYDDLVRQPTFADFLCVCVAEAGLRREDAASVAVANSDPAVMRLANRWLWRLSAQTPRLSIEGDGEHSLSELRRFWGETLGADAHAIGVRRELRAGLRSERLARARGGVLRIAVEDALLHARVQAWMHRTRSRWL